MGRAPRGHSRPPVGPQPPASLSPAGPSGVLIQQHHYQVSTSVDLADEENELDPFIEDDLSELRLEAEHRSRDSELGAERVSPFHPFWGFGGRGKWEEKEKMGK